MYKANIQVLTPNGEEVLDKTIKLGNLLEGILNIDLSLLYAEAQQNEINDGLGMVDEDYDIERD